MPTPPEILAKRDAHNSRFLHVEEVDLAFSNGARRTFERLAASGTAPAAATASAKG